MLRIIQVNTASQKKPWLMASPVSYNDHRSKFTICTIISDEYQECCKLTRCYRSDLVFNVLLSPDRFSLLVNGSDFTTFPCMILGIC